MAAVEQPALGGVERLATRLLALPHDALAELAAQLCRGSAAALRSADEALAAHRPLPQWAVQGVLLSADLAPHVLAPLDVEDGAAAAVCSAWAAGWLATNEQRRRLRVVPHGFPEDLLGDSTLQMAVIPGVEERLILSAGLTTHILDRCMRIVKTLSIKGAAAAVTADEQSIIKAGTVVRRCSLDGEETARYYCDAGRLCDSPVLAPGGRLFAVSYDADDDDQEDIVALDAQSLQLRYRFGSSLFKYAAQMVVAGDELFVCDMFNDRLQVFSLAGEHRRSIVGEYKRPFALCFCKDRLYLSESGDPDDYFDGNDDDDEDAPPVPRGHRIFVLSLQGETLQVFTHPESKPFTSLCCFGRKLLARYYDASSYHVMALRGL